MVLEGEQHAAARAFIFQHRDALLPWRREGEAAVTTGARYRAHQGGCAGGAGGAAYEVGVLPAAWAEAAGGTGIGVAYHTAGGVDGAGHGGNGAAHPPLLLGRKGGYRGINEVF